MQSLTAAVNWLIGLGPLVLVTIILTLVGLVFRIPFGRAFRGGLYVGVGLSGLFLVVDLIVKHLQPAMEAWAKRFGWKSTVVDVGWGDAGLAFGWPGIAWVLLGIIVVNALMVAARLTRTMWTDIWGMWHGQVVGAVLWTLTGNVWLAALGAVVYLVLGSWMGDLTARKYQEFNKIPGISCPAGPTAFYGVLSIPVCWLLDRIPGLKDLDASPDAIRKRFGTLGEPAVLGVILGVILALVAGYNVTQTTQLAVSVSAMLVLLPRMVGIISEGLVPLTQEATALMRERFAGRELFVAVDVAVLVGHPAVMAATVITMPLMLLLSVLLPANQIVIITSLASVPFYLGSVMPWARGNIIKATLAVLLISIPIFYTSTHLVPLHTAAFAKLGLYKEQIAAGSKVASFGMGAGELTTWVLVMIYRLFGFSPPA